MSAHELTASISQFCARPKLVWAFFLVLALVFYGNTLPNGYCVDDQLIIEGNEQAHKGFGAIGEILTTNYLTQGNLKGSYRALPRISLAVEYALFGENPGISHLINLLLFALTGILIYQFVMLLFPAHGAILAITTASIFMAHPIHTEVVASIKNRDELLSFLFGLASCYWLLRYYKTKSPIALVGGAVFFLCALMSKESGQQFLAVIPLTLFVSGALDKKPFILACAVPIIVSVLFWGLLAAILPSGTTTWMAAARSQAGFPFIEHPLLYIDDLNTRMGTAFYSMAYYLRLLIFPHPLGFFYGHNQIPLVGMTNPMALVSMIGHGLLAILAIIKIRSNPLFSFAVLAYLICLSMFSNLIIPMSGIVGERFIYSSSFGFCFAVAILLVRIIDVEKAIEIRAVTPKRRMRPMLFIALLAVLLAVLGIRTIARNFNWKDRITLVTHDAKVFERSGITQLMAGMLCEQKARASVGPERTGLLLKAVGYYAKVASIDPNYLVPLRWAGYVYANDLNQHDQAIEWFKRALQLSPSDPDLRNSLGWSYVKTNRPDLALSEYTQAIQLNPQWSLPLMNRGLLHLDIGNFGAAASDFDKVIVIEPANADAWNNRGWCRYQQENYGQAIVDFDKAIELSPKFALAINNRGLAKLQIGDPASSVGDFDMAISIDPNLNFSYLNRAKAYFQLNMTDKGCIDLEKASSLGINEALDLKNKRCK